MSPIAERAVNRLPQEVRFWHYVFGLGLVVVVAIILVLFLWSQFTGVDWMGRVEVAHFSEALNQLQAGDELTIGGTFNGKEIKARKEVVKVDQFWLIVRRSPNDPELFVRLPTTKIKLEFLRNVRELKTGSSVLWRR